MTYHGILPELPAVATSAGADRATLINYLSQVADDPAGEQKPDTYWAGKGLGRSARIAEIADLVGETATRDKALTAMKKTLENWLTASSGETDHLFYYDQNWGTLIGYDASYGSDQELNDHHFHYGYFIAAAATVAKFDPNWAQVQPVRRHDRPAHPRRQQLRPRRQPLPVPARLRHLRRSRLGLRARRRSPPATTRSPARRG